MDRCTRTSCVGMSAPLPATTAIGVGVVLLCAVVLLLTILMVVRR